jgi:hypothetical protein
MEQDYQQMVRNILTLAPLTDHLPVVQTPEGEYVPLRALCELVGLNPASYIGVFCQYTQPGEMRRLLPWDSPTGRRKDWCVARTYLVYWLVNVPIERVPPDRRAAVESLQKQCIAVFKQTFGHLHDRHKEARRTLFRVLTACAEQQEQLQRYQRFRTLLRGQQRHEFVALLMEGQYLVETLGGAARKALGELMAGPVVDGAVLNEHHEVIGNTTFPLIPVVKDPDPAMFSLMEEMATWSARFHTWVVEHLS